MPLQDANSLTDPTRVAKTWHALLELWDISVVRE